MNRSRILAMHNLDPRALFPSDRAGGEKALALAAHLLAADWLMNIHTLNSISASYRVKMDMLEKEDGGRLFHDS